MKVIITGATGFVGGALIEECLSNPAITSIHIITRRWPPKPIDETRAHPNVNVKTSVLQDLTQLPPSLLEELKGASCCLWAIGGRATKFSSVEEMHRAQHDTTLTAAKAFAETLAPVVAAGNDAGGGKFRFVFCSGKFTVWDQDARLWFLSDSRKSKGFVEKGLFDIAEQHGGVFDVFCARPGGIIAPGKGLIHAATAKIMFGISVDVLAKAMCRIAIDGCTEHIIENDELVRLGSSAG